jgi:hypothetical protein
MQRHVGHPAHAIHPALAIAAPGLLAAGTGLDALAAGRDGALPTLAFWSIAAGVAFGTWCTAWALLDWIFIAELGNASVQGLRALAAATVVTLYGLAVILRLDSPTHPATAPAMALEVCAAALLGVKASLGSELGAWLGR